MDWELLMRIKPLLASIGAATLFGLAVMIVILFVAAIRDEFVRDRGGGHDESKV